MAGYRALLVGAGGMGRTWGKNLAECEQVDFAGWVDIRPGAAAAAVEELQLTGVRCDEELDRAIAELRPDFVVDVTVPEAHHDVTLAALAAGCHVLGEKPMADSMERARAMVAAAERAGRLYMVSQSRRYDAGIQAFRRLIAEQIGEPGILNVDFYLGPHFGGFRDSMGHPLLLDMAIHTFDAARFLSGSDPVSVYCEAFNPPWSWYAGAACASAIFEMSGGLRYTYRASWCSEGASTSWDGDWRAVGPRGSARWDGENAPRADVVAGREGFIRATEPREAILEPIPPGIAGSLRDFLRALDTGDAPMGECHDNIKSLAMVFAAIESAESGRRVSVAR